MNILNHSIPPNGQPLLHPKSSAAHDAPQHLSMAQSLQGAHTMKSFQSNSSKKGSSLLISARDIPPQAESISTVSSDIAPKNEMFQNGALKGLKIPGMEFLCSLSENKKFVRIGDTMGEFDQYISTKPDIVLSVSVSSAVELDGKQIELIARKMQKLTGFRNLKMENIVDPTLIAGFMITYGDDESNVIDLSVKGQLAVLAARVESSERIIANDVQRWSSPTA